VVVRFLGVHWPRLNGWESAVGDAGVGHAFDHSPCARTLDVLLLVGVPLGSVLLAVATVRLYGRGERRLAVTVAATLAGSVATTELLKATLGARSDMPASLANGYPSGHTTAAFATGIGFVLIAQRRRLVTPLAATAGYTAFVAGGVVLDGWHLPTDTLGALCVTAAWTFALLATLRPAVNTVVTRHDIAGAVALAFLAAAMLVAHPGLPTGVPLTRQAVEAVVGVATAALAASVALGWLVARTGRRRSEPSAA
jgi:membrane-associated phospholipid phosphatase